MVILSVGVEYRRLAVPGVDELTGAGVFYGAAVSDAPARGDIPAALVLLAVLGAQAFGYEYRYGTFARPCKPSSGGSSYSAPR